MWIFRLPFRLYLFTLFFLLQSTKSSGFGLILQLFVWRLSAMWKYFCTLFCCSNRMELRNPIWRCDDCWTRKKGQKILFFHRRLCCCALIIVSYRRSFPISLNFLDYRFSSSHSLFLLLCRLSRAKWDRNYCCRIRKATSVLQFLPLMELELFSFTIFHSSRGNFVGIFHVMRPNWRHFSDAADMKRKLFLMSRWVD